LTPLPFTSIIGFSKPTEGDIFLDAGELARAVVEVASEHQASDIVLLDLRPLNVFTDYFIFMSAETQRQMNALVDELRRSLKKSGVPLHHVEGNSQSGWVLVDCGDLVIHILTPEQRDYYRLEELWSRAPEVLRVQ
jgi:ribosome-associated protein